jgi:hypothetical protein
VDTGVSAPATLVLSRNTQFKTENNFKFVTTETYVTQRSTILGGNTYQFLNIPIKEGKFYTYTNEANLLTNPQCKFVIPNANVDTTTLKVSVFQSTSVHTQVEYVKADSYSGDLSGESRIFFLQEGYDGLFEIQFGDNIIGKKLDTGNIVQIEYLVTKKGEANFTQTFELQNAFTGYTVITTTSQVAMGGDEKETLETIRFNAPKQWRAQGRSVTTSDYESLVLNKVSNVESVSVWGGEDNVPPVYGKVFISIKPIPGYTFTNSTKEFVKSTLRSNNVVTIQPEIVDPEYIMISVNTSVKYNPNSITISDLVLKQSIITQLSNYFDNELQKFNKKMYGSKIFKLIDDTNTSILSNTTSFRVSKLAGVETGVAQPLTVELCNQLKPSSLTCSYFRGFVNGSYYNKCRITDEVIDSSGVMGRIKLVDDNTAKTISTDWGDVNYITGTINIYSINPNDTLIGADGILFSGVPTSYDIQPLRNNILILDTSLADTTLNMSNGLTVNVVAEQ